MIGTWINVGTIIVGSVLGLFFGARLPERMRSTVIVALGLFTFALGIDLFIEGVQSPGENPLIPLVSLLLGAILGEWWRLDERLNALGARLEERISGSTEDGSAFIRGTFIALNRGRRGEGEPVATADSRARHNTPGHGSPPRNGPARGLRCLPRRNQRALPGQGRGSARIRRRQPRVD